MTSVFTQTTAATVHGSEYVPYTKDDYDFIQEITADFDPVIYQPTASLIPLKIRQRGWDQQAAKQLNQEYNFPWSSFVGRAEQDDLTAWLDEIVMKIEFGKDGYMRHRDSFCMLSLAMNQLGLKAPAFRPQVPIPWKPEDQTPEHMVIQRDRIVIDCHWLYCTKSKVYATEGVWRGIVNPKLSLQTERIEQFAASKLRNDSRADEILELTPYQQVQMAAMRGSKVRDAFKDLGATVNDVTGKRTPARFRKITSKLQQWSDTQPRFAKLYPKYRAYAMALELLEFPTTRQVAQLAGLILGEPPLAASTASQILQKLKAITKGI